MSDRPAVGRFASLLGLLTGLGAVALGVGLVRRAESAFGLTWASLMVVLGVIVLLSFVSQFPASSRPARASSPTPWQGEAAEFFPRRSDRARLIGLVILVLLGGWFAVMGIVGAVEANWLWPVLAAVPAAYFLGLPTLALLGRFSAGGVWLTTTRLVNEQHGLRSEIALHDIAEVRPRSQSLHVEPVAPGVVAHQSLMPWPWRAKGHARDLVIGASGFGDGIEGLAEEIRRAAAAAGRQRT